MGAALLRLQQGCHNLQQAVLSVATSQTDLGERAAAAEDQSFLLPLVREFVGGGVEEESAPLRSKLVLKPRTKGKTKGALLAGMNNLRTHNKAGDNNDGNNNIYC